MRENNRKPIEKCRKKLPQFTTMNVIDGQAGLVSYFSLIFYSLTIDNILNIIVLLILAAVSIATLTGENGILTRATQSKEETTKEGAREKLSLILNELQIEKIPKGESLVLGNALASEIGAFDEVTSATYTGQVIEVVIDGYTFEVNGDLGIENKKEIAKVEPENLDDWEVDYDTYPGYARLTSYKGDATDLVIPNYINGYWVKAIGYNEKDKKNGFSMNSLWDKSICEEDGIYSCWQNHTIKSITISEGIEIIEDESFIYTTDLEEVKIASTINTIGFRAFYLERYYAKNGNLLEGIYLPKTILTIDWNAFYGRNETIVYVEYEENEIPEPQYVDRELISGWDEKWNYGLENNVIYGVKV